MLALCYEVAVAIISGKIVWINGPYPAGRYNDVRIFRDSLQTFLDAGERVEADDGYRGDPTICKVPADVLMRENEEEDAMQKRVQDHHKAVNAPLSAQEL